MTADSHATLENPDVGDDCCPKRALDPSVLAEIASLQEPGEPDVLAQVIGNFLACAGPRLDALKLAWNNGDHASLARCAHAVTGSVGVFGAWRLIELLRSVERAALNRDRSQIAAVMDDLLVEYQRAEAELRETLLRREVGG